MSGDVPAAVLALVSSEAADGFPKSQVSRFSNSTFASSVERATTNESGNPAEIGCRLFNYDFPERTGQTPQGRLPWHILVDVVGDHIRVRPSSALVLQLEIIIMTKTSNGSGTIARA